VLREPFIVLVSQSVPFDGGALRDKYHLSTSRNVSINRPFRIRIKQASPKDAHGIVLLANVCIQDLAGTNSRRIAKVISERIRTDLERYPGTCLVACEGKKPVAFSLTEVTGSSASILLLAVDSRYRRKGVGSALVSSTISLLEDAGVEYVDLATPLENEIAQSFWATKGFIDARVKVFSKFLGHHHASRRRRQGRE